MANQNLDLLNVVGSPIGWANPLPGKKSPCRTYVHSKIATLLQAQAPRRIADTTGTMVARYHSRATCTDMSSVSDLMNLCLNRRK